MTLHRAQTILSYFTALPEDVATNTTYWDSPNDPMSGAELDEVENRLEAAYDLMGTRLAPILSRTATVKIYRMADPEPRQPVRAPGTFTYPAASPATNLPLECAAVISYHRLLISGLPPARARGRMYIGPLGTGAANFGSATVMPLLDSACVTALVNFAIALQTPINVGVTVVWMQYSKTLDDFGEVVGGWVDNEFDTQRRRQARATARTLYTV